MTRGAEAPPTDERAAVAGATAAASPRGANAPRRPLSWRRLVRIVHRDLGYAAAALTIVYAVSGVAVNHVHDWNPNYSIERTTSVLPPLAGEIDRERAVAHVVAALGLPGPPKNAFRPAPHRVQLFYEGTTVDADLAAGTATVERPRERPVLRDVNFLHLNHPKGAWTWIADVYAVGLALLALTGIFILGGRQGLAGRGKWFVLLGLAIPLVALLLLRWT